MNRSQSITLMQRKKSVPKEFNFIAKRYDLATLLNQGYSRDLETSVRRMNLKGNEHLLDLCCGTGKSTFPCIKALPKGKIIGVDYSEGMLQIAQKKRICQKDRVSFQLQDAMNLDFAEHSFDAIFMAYGIRNMSDPKKCLEQLFKILKPGGQLCLHEYSLAENIFSRAYWWMLGYCFVVPFCTLLTGKSSLFRYLIKSVDQFPRPTAFSKKLEETGFTKVSATPLHSWRKPFLHTFRAFKPKLINE